MTEEFVPKFKVGDLVKWTDKSYYYVILGVTNIGRGLEYECLLTNAYGQFQHRFVHVRRMVSMIERRCVFSEKLF